MLPFIILMRTLEQIVQAFKQIAHINKINIFPETDGTFFYYLYQLGIDLKHNLELPISQIDNFTLYAFFGVFRESMYVKSTISHCRMVHIILTNLYNQYISAGRSVLRAIG